MDKEIDGQVDKEINRQMDKQMRDQQKDKIINRQIGLKTIRYEDKFIERQKITYKQID